MKAVVFVLTSKPGCADFCGANIVVITIGWLTATTDAIATAVAIVTVLGSTLIAGFALASVWLQWEALSV